MEYALYEGDNFVMIGTIEEIASKLNVKEDTVRFYGTPSHIKKCERQKKQTYKVIVKLG